MTIRFPCPSCQHSIKAPDNYAGRAVNCPGCGTKLTVPAATAESPSAAAAPVDKLAAERALLDQMLGGPTASEPAPAAPAATAKEDVAAKKEPAAPARTAAGSAATASAVATSSSGKTSSTAKASVASASTQSSAGDAAADSGGSAAAKSSSKSSSKSASATGTSSKSAAAKGDAAKDAAAGPTWQQSPWVDAWLAVAAIGLVLVALSVIPLAPPAWSSYTVATASGDAPDFQVRIAADHRLHYQNKTYDDPELLVAVLEASGRSPSRVQLVVDHGVVFGTVERTVAALGRHHARSIQVVLGQ